MKGFFASPRRSEPYWMTGDLGFANMLRHPLGSHHGIIVARFPSEMPSHTINEHVAKALKNLSPADIQGNVIILEAGRVRIRRMK